ncbi:GTPase [Planctomycetes bacterium Pla163]|uniref:GTPase n=1 Tax=Rohdeia mirabilis TaxID=2528008 RepID=UPI0011A50517
MKARTSDLSVRELTAAAPGGVAVLEVSGANARAAVERLLVRELPAPGRVRLARLVEADELLDEGLVVVRRSGAIELHLHGSPAVVARVRRALFATEVAARVHTGSAPAASARPSGVPITWADAARDLLPRALSRAGARLLLDQSEGALDRALDALVTGAAPADRARRLVAAGQRARPFLAPPVVVLAGPVNAGKSTLFNLLVGRERALASDRPGTTRDAVRDVARDGDLVVELVDTAGRRAGVVPEGEGGAGGGSAGAAALEPDTAPLLEVAGQRLGRALARGADLVLWCRPADEDPHAAQGDDDPDDDLDGGPTLAAELITRSDLAPVSLAPGTARLSAATDPDAARATVWCAIRSALGVDSDPWRPGEPVPFDAELLAALERALADGDAGVRAAAAAGAFAPPGARSQDRAGG